jgi:hypothetical protein
MPYRTPAGVAKEQNMTPGRGKRFARIEKTLEDDEEA